MRWLLHTVGLILLGFAAILCERTVSGSDLADAICFAFAGLACWCASDLKVPPKG